MNTVNYKTDQYFNQMIECNNDLASSVVAGKGTAPPLYFSLVGFFFQNCKKCDRKSPQMGEFRHKIDILAPIIFSVSNLQLTVGKLHRPADPKLFSPTMLLDLWVNSHTWVCCSKTVHMTSEL